LFFALRPSQAVLGDFNSDLISTYRVIARHPRIVSRKVSSLPDTCDVYYRIRALDTSTLSEIDRATRFMYLNRHCFNGVYRTDASNRFNVPRGTRAGRNLTEAEVYRCSLALRDATLVAGDFTNTLKVAKRNDFVYLDPPYSAVARPTIGEYGYGAFAKSDIDRLLELLHSLSTRGAKVLFSFTADRAVLSALKEWNVARIRVRRQIAGGARNAVVTEILASNFKDLRSFLRKDCRGPRK